jgi:hypothetical protein
MTPCGGCGDKAAALALQRSRIIQTRVETLEKPVQAGHVRIKYMGTKVAPVTYYANGHPYPAANTPKWKFLDVPEQDANVLLGMNCFIRVNTVSIIAPVAVAVATGFSDVTKIDATGREIIVSSDKPNWKQPAPKPVDPVAMANAVAEMEAQTGEKILSEPHTDADQGHLGEKKTYKPRKKK